MTMSNFIYADLILIIKFLQVFDILKCFHIIKITKVTHEGLTKTHPHCVFSSVCFSRDSANPAISSSAGEKTRISHSSSITHVHFSLSLGVKMARFPSGINQSYSRAGSFFIFRTCYLSRR